MLLFIFWGMLSASIKDVENSCCTTFSSTLIICDSSRTAFKYYIAKILEVVCFQQLVELVYLSTVPRFLQWIKVWSMERSLKTDLVMHDLRTRQTIARENSASRTSAFVWFWAWDVPFLDSFLYIFLIVVSCWIW